MSKRETSSEIDDAAALWAVRLEDAELDEEARKTFDRWLEGDTRRIGAFVRAQAVLVHARRAKALGADYDPSAFTETETAATPYPNMRNEQAAPPARLSRRKLLLGASAIAATGVFALMLPIRRASARVYETGLGETRLVPLEDGSTVTLNTRSSITVTMDATSRRVQLVQGEALFKVADAKRAPFLVEVGDTSLRAQEATFGVCRLGEAPLQVSVCEGDVDIARGSDGPHRLRANMQATLPANGAVIERSVEPETLQRELAWQEGMLSFEDTPLRQAAGEFARYSDRRIGIPDAGVGAETVTGRFAANNPEGFARAVALSLNLHVQSSASGIMITR